MASEPDPSDDFPNAAFPGSLKPIRMRILIASLGSHGDVHPYLALGRELIRRGQRVTFATSVGYRELVERHGLEFAPMRPEARWDDLEFMRKVMSAREGPDFLIKRFLMPAVRDMYADLAGPAAEADLLVSHVLTYAVPIMAEKLGKPWASTVLSPMVFFSAHDVPVLAQLPALAGLRRLGPGFNAGLFRLMKWISRPWARPVGALRRELALPPGRDALWEGQHSPRLVLAMFGARFGPPQPDWPSSTVSTGFPFLEPPGGALDPELERFLAAGEKPIVFTLGSAAVQVPGRFFAEAMAAARQLGRRAVLVAGASAAALRDRLPPGMMASEWASYARLFPRAAAVVHQGGVGTTAEALRAGVPQVVMPFAYDQFDNAARVRRLGCGTSIRRNGVSARSLRRGLEAVLDRTEVAAAARREGDAIRPEDGAARAAEVMLERFG